MIKFNKDFYLIILSIAGLLIFYFLPLKYLGETFPICIYKNITGNECWGCGTTRAVSCIMHFDFSRAYHYNKLIVITFPLMVICYISWVVKKIHSVIV